MHEDHSSPDAGPLARGAYESRREWDSIRRARERELRARGLPPYENRSGAGRIAMRMELRIAAPVHALWGLFNEYEHWGLVSGVRFERLVDSRDPGNPWGVGSRRRIRVAPGLAYEEEITASERDREIRYTFMRGAPIEDHEGIYRFEELGPDATTYVFEMNFRPTFPLSLVRTPVAAQLCRENAQAMAMLAHYAEEDPWFFRRVRFLPRAFGELGRTA